MSIWYVRNDISIGLWITFDDSLQQLQWSKKNDSSSRFLFFSSHVFTARKQHWIKYQIFQVDLILFLCSGIRLLFNIRPTIRDLPRSSCASNTVRCSASLRPWVNNVANNALYKCKIFRLKSDSVKNGQISCLTLIVSVSATTVVW